MQLGMVGLGRMGANMVRRLAARGHECVAFDRAAAAVDELAKVKGVAGATSFADMIAKLAKPRAIWLMIPAGVVDNAATSKSDCQARAESMQKNLINKNIGRKNRN